MSILVHSYSFSRILDFTWFCLSSFFGSDNYPLLLSEVHPSFSFWFSNFLMLRITLFCVFLPRVKSIFHGGLPSVLLFLGPKSAPTAIGSDRDPERTGLSIKVSSMLLRFFSIKFPVDLFSLSSTLLHFFRLNCLPIFFSVSSMLLRFFCLV